MSSHVCLSGRLALVCAAPLFAHLAQAAISTPDYTTSFDSSGLTIAPSTQIPGTAITFASSAGDWSGTPVYIAVRGSATDKALTLASSTTPYNEGSIVGNGSFSFLTVARLPAGTAPIAIASVSSASWNNGKGLTLIYHDGKVKLVDWRKGAAAHVLAEATVPTAEQSFHSYLVVFKKSTTEGVASTAELYVDGSLVASDSSSVENEPGIAGYQLGGVYGGTGELKIGSEMTQCQKGAGVQVDEVIIWKSDVSAQAAEIAAHYSPWPDMSASVDLEKSGAYAVSAMNTEAPGASIINLTLTGDLTLTVDQAIAADGIKVKGEGKTLTLTGSALDAAALAKIEFADLTGTVVFASDCAVMPAVAPKTGLTYRFEKDLTEGVTLNQGAGNYSFANAKISNGNAGTGYVLTVGEGDSLQIVAGNDDLRGNVSLNVTGGEVKLGKDDGNAAIWYGVGGTTYDQTGGTVTVMANGQGQSGNGQGFLLGWSGALTRMNISGGVLDVSNSSFNFWSSSTTINVSNAATVKAKGVFRGSAGGAINLSDSSVFELGSLGWKTVPLALSNTAKVKVVDSTAIAAPITLADTATFDVPSDKALTLSGTITGDRAVTLTGAGTLKLAGEAVAAKLGEIAGPIVYVASPALLADGVITGATTQTSYGAGQITVVNEAGNSVDADIVIADGVITLTLNAQNVKASGNVSEWNQDWEGEVSVKGTEESPITINVNDAFPAGVTTLKVFGPVTFAYADGLEASPVVIEPQSGSTVSVSGTIANTISIPAGGKLVTSGDVTILSSKAIQTPGQKNATVEIPADSTLTLTANNQIAANVTVNVYGTLDIGATTLSYNNNPSQCEYNFYAGSVMTGTGSFRMTGGYTAKYYVRANAAAENQFVTFDVPRSREYFDCATEVYVDAGVGLKWLKPSANDHVQPITVIGTEINGLEVRSGTFKVGRNEDGYDRCLRNYVKIAADANLIIDSRHDIINYGSGKPNAPAFDIAGTLQCDKRQTIFAANAMTLHDGAKITGTGELHNTITKAMDICENLTMTIDGVATLDAPLCQRDANEHVTFVAAAEATTVPVVVIKQNFTGATNNTAPIANGVAVIVESAVTTTPTIPDAATNGCIVKLNETAAYTAADGVVTFTIPAEASRTVELGTVTAKGALPTSFATSNAKYSLKVRNGKLFAEKPSFTVSIR